MLVMETDRGFVPQGLVRSTEVVLYQPFGKVLVELLAVARHVPHGDKLFLQGPVESFVKGIVRGSLYPREILGNTEPRGYLPEVQGKL